jgi:PPK2 family polyphosphate:nucleotide phosphotransferase
MNEKRGAGLAGTIKPFHVKPGTTVDLAKDFDPGYTGDYEKERAEEMVQEGISLLREYQARLAAQNTYGLLVVIQALDAAGKDGTISHVMSGVNPQGVTVQSFKSPSTEELDHDYLWRCAKVLPARGDITIFNRSYYEEVLVVRVHREYLAAERIPLSCKQGDIWKRRYREINCWERYLVDNGFRIVKLLLNVSKEEQRRRFLDRLEQPEKNWKFSAADVAERKHWDEYQQAFSEMLSNTSTRLAPWYVIPADHKWFARSAAAAVIVDALAKIDPQFPTVTGEAKQALLEAEAALEAEAPRGSKNRPAEGPVSNTDQDADGDPAGGHSDKPPGKPRGLQGKVIRFGEIELDGKRYTEDLVIERGKVRKRKKKASKVYRDEGGHTPLSTAEDIPWGQGRLIVGTGINGALPVMAEVYEEANKRGVQVVALPLADALRLLEGVSKKETFAVLHVTC